MTPFLKQVATHYMAEGSNVSRLCFIFPNRRSLAFFKKYLCEEVRCLGCPVVAPAMYTVNDFFSRISDLKVSDRVDLILELYDCYKVLYPKAESLDEFVGWGDIILGDFDDVDKYLSDPEKLFTNVADFKAIQDSLSYLTPVQREAISRFISHFRPEVRKSFKGGEIDVKENFLQIWNILLPLYRSFRSALVSKGKAYEGMLYRSIAESVREKPVADVLAGVFPETVRFVFVGLNALNECERTLMKKMRDAGLAEFCWDYSSEMVRDPGNKSSFFMAANVQEFPQSFEYDPEGLTAPEIEVVSVPSSVGQAKLLPSILKDDTYAVVIPDESLLLPVLNSIPAHIEDINVTMGFPMKDSAFYGFLSLVLAMQMHLRTKGDEVLFYHGQVWSIFASGIFKHLIRNDAKAQAAVKAVREGHRYYIPEADLRKGPVMDLLFRIAVRDPKSNDASQIRDICLYLKRLIAGIAPLMAGDEAHAVEVEFAKAAYSAIGRLQTRELGIFPATFFKLLGQLLQPVAVPFNGEPLKGLQVMGPLETRALDFTNLVILSCNEGMFPRRSVSSSFIPPELRKAFGLPTYEYQDAVWAYYFYRLIQRAQKVTLVYDSRTEGLKGGEESRYIKQLEYHYGLPLKRMFANSKVGGDVSDRPVIKTKEDLEILHKRNLSASALKEYLDCPAMFYYDKVKGLKPSDEVSEDLDAGMVGNVFHKTMCDLYSQYKSADDRVTAVSLKSILSGRDAIKGRVRANILSELNSSEVSGRDLVAEEVITEYVVKTVSRDLELLTEGGFDSFGIIGLEKMYIGTMEGFSFIGFIDRLDSFRPGEIRIVDYKTGKVGKDDVEITDANAKDVADKLFGSVSKNRPKIALQLFLYDYLVRKSGQFSGSRIVNSIYSPVTLAVEPVKEVPLSGEFLRLAGEGVRQLLREISSLETGEWKRTEDTEICKNCDFRMICGR